MDFPNILMIIHVKYEQKCFTFLSANIKKMNKIKQKWKPRYKNQQYVAISLFLFQIDKLKIIISMNIKRGF